MYTVSRSKVSRLCNTIGKSMVPIVYVTQSVDLRSLDYVTQPANLWFL